MTAAAPVVTDWTAEGTRPAGQPGEVVRDHGADSWYYRPIPGFPGYEASPDGHIRTTRPYGGVLRVLKTYPNHNGYPTVKLTLGGGRKQIVTVHRLVMLTFVGPRPKGMQIAHGDGDKTNNDLTNLRYATPKENSQDTLRHGRHPEARKTHCIRGHALSGDNVARRKDKPNARICRTCRSMLRRARRRAAA